MTQNAEYVRVGWLIHWYDDGKERWLFSDHEHNAGEEWSEPIYVRRAHNDSSGAES